VKKNEIEMGIFDHLTEFVDGKSHLLDKCEVLYHLHNMLLHLSADKVKHIKIFTSSYGNDTAIELNDERATYQCHSIKINS
jgi:hypothetical protein